MLLGKDASVTRWGHFKLFHLLSRFNKNVCVFFYFLVQHGESAVKTHHLEYAEGGILDMDDMLSDLVEDRDKVRTEEEEEYFVLKHIWT